MTIATTTDEDLEQAQAEEEEALSDELTAMFIAWASAVWIDQLSSSLDDSDARHIRRQVALILDLDDSGLPRPIADTLAPISTRIADYAQATATRIARQVGYTPTPQVLQAIRQSADSFLNTYRGDTAQATAAAIETAIYAPGDPAARAKQLIRSIGLSIPQADALDRMREVLTAYLAMPKQLIPGRTLPTGRRIRAQYVRQVDTSALLAATAGHLSAAQRRMLARALDNPRLSEADADALLDRHAAALRLYRTGATIQRGLHELTEGAKLATWQAAQAAGVLPSNQRRFWVTARDERVRAAHRAVPIMNPNGVALGEPFKTPLGNAMHPPLEWGCRCRVYLRKPT